MQSVESFIKDHVMKHFKVNTIFNDNQYEFIEERSTNLLQLSVLNKWSKTQKIEDKLM